MNAIQMPPVPTWEGLHPLVVHFPIALLLIAPIFLVAALALRQRGRWLALAALALMVVGTAGAYIAAESGEAAAELAEGGDAMSAVLERHEELAELTTTLFTVLTSTYALLMVTQWWFSKLSAARFHLPLHGIFLLAFLAAGVVLGNTAHQGGTLVHQFGVHSMMSPASGTPSPGTSSR